MNELELKFLQIFFPYSYKKQMAIESNGTRLVHYTSAEAAMNIIKTKELWLRESSCMNDFTEVTHGMDCVIAAYKSASGENFKKTLNELFPGITSEVEKLFDSWRSYLETDTYIACFSEHDDKEDMLGRLSMWRAYSKSTGVALVLNSSIFFNESDAFEGLYASPVAYLDEGGVCRELEKIVENINREKEFVRVQHTDLITALVFRALVFASLGTKHLGFEEEKELRLTYSPAFEKCPNLLKDHKVINGLPQIIYKIPLIDMPNRGVVGLEIPSLINRIIIGPSEYPLALRKAFMSLLTEAGVEDAGARVCVSGIPLR